MFEIIAVTHRALCQGAFLERVGALAALKIPLILREKDLFSEEYRALAGEVSRICVRQGASFIAHGFPEAAALPGCAGFHAPFSLLSNRPGLRDEFPSLKMGASVHSVEEALRAVSLGVDYLVAGHIFETACKNGLKARGLEFLSEVVRRVEVPVYAIGGISGKNIGAVRAAGAAGVCLMSPFMQDADPAAYAAALRTGLGRQQLKTESAIDPG